MIMCCSPVLRYLVYTFLTVHFALYSALCTLQIYHVAQLPQWLHRSCHTASDEAHRLAANAFFKIVR